MASKKLRFEIFKRDNFTCQYCGHTPPEVMLELDHIVPKAKGGTDDINNYLTACFDCNRGKGAEELTAIPSSLKDNMALIKEKQEQIKAYNKFLQKIIDGQNATLQNINALFSAYFSDYQLSDNFKQNTLKRFISLLPIPKIEEAMRMACSKFEGYSNQDYASTKAIKYFCGICWNWIKKSETRGW